MEQLTLRLYCKNNGITMSEFSRMTGISLMYLYKIQSDRKANISVDKVIRIYSATEKRFGTPLDLWEYHDKN